jgi:catechol 2,3-dioxygenase-like lactoylglutathione lyase family enzyme
MKLEFLFIPTADLTASLALYRDGLGFTELWREGDTTVALSLPGSGVHVMLDANDPSAPVGPIFVVDSAVAFHASRPDSLTVIDGPSEIPGGYVVTYQEPGGAFFYVMDQSTDTAN